MNEPTQEDAIDIAIQELLTKYNENVEMTIQINDLETYLRVLKRTFLDVKENRSDEDGSEWTLFLIASDYRRNLDRLNKLQNPS